jgi:broad specificity phosphatase PhoE
MILLRHGQSHFNVVFAVTREDPGVIDPRLTPEGRRQIAGLVEDLQARGVRRILASPYWRTLETAQILAEALGLPVAIEPLVREQAYFSCDIGSPRSHLDGLWPQFDFGGLPERWWPEAEESEAELMVRCRRFRNQALELEDWREVLVVTHWAFIRGLTGIEAANGALIPFDPSGQAE